MLETLKFRFILPEFELDSDWDDNMKDGPGNDVFIRIRISARWESPRPNWDYFGATIPKQHWASGADPNLLHPDVIASNVLQRFEILSGEFPRQWTRDYSHFWIPGTLDDDLDALPEVTGTDERESAVDRLRVAKAALDAWTELHAHARDPHAVPHPNEDLIPDIGYHGLPVFV